MDTQSVLNTISNISVGSVVAWIAVIVSIISAICAGTIKLYKIFTKYRKIKDENEEQSRLIQKHDDTLDKIEKSLNDINKALEEQKAVNLRQLRYTISHTCDDAISAGSISASKLRSLEEMYEEYINLYNANGYVKTMMVKTRKLPITGKLE